MSQYAVHAHTPLTLARRVGHLVRGSLAARWSLPLPYRVGLRISRRWWLVTLLVCRRRSERRRSVEGGGARRAFRVIAAEQRHRQGQGRSRSEKQGRGRVLLVVSCVRTVSSLLFCIITVLPRKVAQIWASRERAPVRDLATPRLASPHQFHLEPPAPRVGTSPTTSPSVVGWWRARTC